MNGKDGGGGGGCSAVADPSSALAAHGQGHGAPSHWRDATAYRENWVGPRDPEDEEWWRRVWTAVLLVLGLAVVVLRLLTARPHP